MEYKSQLGDIFLCDSDRPMAGIVKLLMQAPTPYQWIFRYFKGTLEKVRYYHAGMILDDLTMVEQQGTCKYGQTQKILSRRITIYRLRRNLKNCYADCGQPLEEVFKSRMLADIGAKYGVVSVFGKLLTWLTGIKWFERVIHWDNTEICVNRVGKWYVWICNFGVKNYRELNTRIVDNYCSKNKEEWELVYTNE